MSNSSFSRLRRLKLGPQFAFLIALIFLAGIILGSLRLTYAIQEKAEMEVADRAEILIQTANAVRKYTSTRVNPHLAEQLEIEEEFISETVPAFSAREVFEYFRQQPKYENFLYKEATLNPSNPRDLADNFEEMLVDQFRQQPSLMELKGYRSYEQMVDDLPIEDNLSAEADLGLKLKMHGDEKWFYIARPLAVNEESCLRCHGDPAAAPRSLIQAYGTEAGFGWKLNEIVAAQTIYVPANEVFARSRQYLGLVIGVFAGVSAAVVLAIRFLLQQKVVLPVRRLTNFTSLVGTEQKDANDTRPLDTQGLAQLTRRFDEIGELARAFKAMALEIRGREADLTKKVKARTAQLARSTRAAERARQQAENANQSKSQFLANMSHELRTPLNAILGFAQIIDRTKSLQPEHQKHLNTILRSGEHLLALINDVLDMAKIEAGRASLNEATFNLHTLLDSLETMFQLRCKEKGIQLYFWRSPDVPEYIESDESKLRQILINLLGNAVKFTHTGSISLRVASSFLSPKSGDREPANSTSKIELSFEVTDTGIGIAQTELEAIFEPFVQTRSSQFSGKGTGLGLPISRQFARIMGGRMWVSSELGQGSCFRWYIIADLAQSTPTNEKNNAYRRAIGLAPGQSSKRILVVDDRLENRELLINFLCPIGFEVRTAADGQAGVDCWRAWKPHLIWMDIRMPGMDGLKATRQIRMLEKRNPDTSEPRTVIIALTASTLTQERDVAFESGCDDFMRKPFLASELFEKMAHWLEVNYVYEEAEVTTNSHQSADELELETLNITQILAGMPDEWLTGVEDAARSLDYAALVKLIEPLSAKNPQLADSIKTWVDGFAYDRILAVISDARQRSTND